MFRFSLSRPKEATGTIFRKFLSAENYRIRVAFVAFGRACPIDEEGLKRVRLRRPFGTVTLLHATIIGLHMDGVEAVRRFPRGIEDIAIPNADGTESDDQEKKRGGTDVSGEKDQCLPGLEHRNLILSSCSADRYVIEHFEHSEYFVRPCRSPSQSHRLNQCHRPIQPQESRERASQPPGSINSASSRFHADLILFSPHTD